MLPTTAATGFRVTVDQLEAARTSNTKVLLFVSPSNPTGAVYPPDEVEAIGRWAVEHGIWVVTDEIYEHLTFGEHVFTSMPALVPELAERCVVLNGVAKTYAMTGWRVGWMIGPEDVIARGHQPAVALDVERRATSRSAPRSRRCRGDLEAVARCATRSRGAARRCTRCSRGIPGVDVPRAAGRVLLLPELRGASSAASSAAGRSSTTLELAEVLLDEAKVAIVPGEAFGAPGYARLSFALGDDDLGEGVGRIADFLA